MQPNNRTPSLDKDKINKVGRKLSQSPSVVNIQGGHLNSDDGGEDDQQPMKPTINYDPNAQDMESNPGEMPMIAQKHRQGASKK